MYGWDGYRGDGGVIYTTRFIYEMLEYACTPSILFTDADLSSTKESSGQALVKLLANIDQLLFLEHTLGSTIFMQF